MNEIKLLKIFLHKDYRSEILEILNKFNHILLGSNDLKDNIHELQILIKMEEVEEILETLNKLFYNKKHFRIIVSNIDTITPRKKTLDKLNEIERPYNKYMIKPKLSKRISKHHLYESLQSMGEFNSYYFLMVVLSAIIAAVGLIKSSPSIIIGAMVIAPLLGPNVSLSFATLLGENEMEKKASFTLLIGIFSAFVLALFIGLFFNNFIDGHFDKSLSYINYNNEISSRIHFDLGDVIIALASGIAGVLSITTGAPSTLVGVMVAVALMPPLVTSGMLFGKFDFLNGSRAFILLVINLICINIAAILTFYLQGIRPNTWWQSSVSVSKSIKLLKILICSLLILFIAVFIHSYIKNKV